MDVTEDELSRLEAFYKASRFLRRTLLRYGATQGDIQWDRRGKLQQFFSVRVAVGSGRNRRVETSKVRINETSTGYWVSRFHGGRLVGSGPLANNQSIISQFFHNAELIGRDDADLPE